MAQAQSLLERALVLQPGYPDALSALAWLLLRKMYSSADPQHDADLAEARRMVKLAVAAAPNDSEALAAEGLLMEADGQVPDAQARYEAALSLDSSSVAARTGLIHVLLRRGLFDEAVRRLNDLLLIDPEGPRNKVRYHDLGYAYLMQGHPEDALVWLGRAVSGDSAGPDRPDELGRMEWDKLLQIAATDMVGNTSEARALYAQYSQVLRHRSIWRLASNVARAQSSQPGFRRFADALKDAGMPEFDDDVEVAADSAPHGKGAFDPLPARMPGVPTIDTTGVTAMLPTSPVIVDFGIGPAALPNALMGGFDQNSPEDAQRFVHDMVGKRAVIVMGDGPYDREAYEAALQLHRAGVARLFWYRGGEEAWARAGLRGEDRRRP